MMKKSDSCICVALPSLYPNKQIRDPGDSQRNQLRVQLPNEENEVLMVSELDRWNGKDNGRTRRSKNVTAFKSSNSLQNDIRKVSIQAAEVMEARLYLVRHEEQLRKVEQFDYLSVFKNIEYCSGMYDNVYNLILKTLQKHHSTLSLMHSQLCESVEKQRMGHILNMERSINSESYKQKIPAVRQLIEDKQNQLQPLKDLIQNLSSARIKVLKHCLSLGYDVREDGLVWILRELGSVPRTEDFPTFLHKEQIQFIINRFQRQRKGKQKQKQALRSTRALCNKSVNEVRNYLIHNRKRELSMIKEGQIMEQLQKTYLDDYMHENHKYLTEDVLRLAQKEKHKSKATKYEIIYRETGRKLNRFCVNQIYKQSKYHQKSRGAVQNRRESINTTKMLSLVESKIAVYMNDMSNETSLDDGEKDLDAIIRKLRYESYQQQNRSERRSRNVVTIICCLVGLKRARKIIEQQMNYVF